MIVNVTFCSHNCRQQSHLHAKFVLEPNQPDECGAAGRVSRRAAASQSRLAGFSTSGH